MSNYDYDVLGVGNPSHPANQKEGERELTLSEKYELICRDLPEDAQNYVDKLVSTITYANDVLRGLPENKEIEL